VNNPARAVKHYRTLIELTKQRVKSIGVLVGESALWWAMFPFFDVSRVDTA
jgi:hypothetical protein